MASIIGSTETSKYWYVMRDLKRSNAKLPGYKLLEKKQIRVFTPMKWELTGKSGIQTREQVPVIKDLLFAYSSLEELAPILQEEPKLQHRYVRGGKQHEPMIVRSDYMERFIHAVQSSDTPCFYLPEEITPNMYKRRIRIIGGALNNYEGHLVTVRGSRIKRLLVELPNLLAVAIEVNPEYIMLID
ncbi:MAG: hypothetical protein PARBB_00809 [Parabacteroides distasonis]|uniref:UpxY family transcription antiterminator n=1 Tax=Parabacteroides sp. TaxID=1869337 RepID=UPI0026E00090|nr:UpxY family transcription antiterminator [Parabacteroides sp.]MDO5428792.1 UpxY family transcription antiterminator [Parabacteroides sp.]